MVKYRGFRVVWLWVMVWAYGMAGGFLLLCGVAWWVKGRAKNNPNCSRVMALDAVRSVASD